MSSASFSPRESKPVAALARLRTSNGNFLSAGGLQGGVQACLVFDTIFHRPGSINIQMDMLLKSHRRCKNYFSGGNSKETQKPPRL
jgi:hypothetical protein